VSSRRRGSAVTVPIALITTLIVLGGVGVGIGKLWQAAQSGSRANGCDIGAYSLDLDQTENASVMVSLVIKRNLPERAAVLTLAAGLQESKLRNLDYGDSDSLGILQQRPSQGWGTAAQVSDVRYATGKFLDALVKVDNWKTEPLADAIQAVQRSADGSAYAKHEPQAQTMSDALMGVTAAGVSCSFDKPTVVAGASAVAKQLSADLPVSAPAITGQQLRVAGAAWTTVAWFVSHANTYGLDSVSYANQTWTRAKGWKAGTSAELDAVTATLATPPKQ
jgi:hypothetical protein